MTLLLLQITVVLAVSLLCGRIAGRLGQARVIGEIFGGILLGPSIFGRVTPVLFTHIFPADSLRTLELLSTLGLILFLFLIGNEFDSGQLKQRRSTAIFASTASIALPFCSALLIVPAVRARFAGEGVSELAFALFFGISMSITAFPVLARILEERALQKTSLGTTALVCAAVNDVAAWILLAFALTLVSSNSASMSYHARLLWLGVYLAVMLFVVRPFWSWLAKRRRRPELSYELLGAMIAFALISSAVTDAIGIHPLFGAFLAGLCTPRNHAWQQFLRERLDAVLSLLLLPLFFALTGLHLRFDLMNDLQTWLGAGLILLLATVSKLGGAALGAKIAGQDWRFSLALGALLNTRGLVELIVLNIAYSAHVFSSTLFTMLVVMAVVTTTMTVPILDLLKVREPNTATN